MGLVICYLFLFSYKGATGWESPFHTLCKRIIKHTHLTHDLIALKFGTDKEKMRVNSRAY